MYIQEVNSSSGIYDVCGKCSDHVYFDTGTGVWMDNSPGWTLNEGLTGNKYLHAADVSVNTMGGLHIFWSSVVPLTANKFVLVGNGGGSASYINPLVKTIVATNLAVATPVSTAQQIATIQAEQSAYAGQ